MIAGDAELARCAASHLTGLGGRFAVIAHATVTLGPVDRMLGLLALTQGDAEAADHRPSRRRCSRQAGATVAGSKPARPGHRPARPGRAPDDTAEAACLFDSVRLSATSDPNVGIGVVGGAGRAWNVDERPGYARRVESHHGRAITAQHRPEPAWLRAGHDRRGGTPASGCHARLDDG